MELGLEQNLSRGTSTILVNNENGGPSSTVSLTDQVENKNLDTSLSLFN